MEDLLRKLDLEEFYPILEEQHFDIDVLRMSMENKILMPPLQQFLQSRGMKIGEFILLA